MFEEWKEENGYSVQLTGLFPENVVAFYMGGFGLAPSSVYYGFYYSPEDIPVGTGEGQLVKAEGDNAGWSWQGGAVRPGRGAAPDVLKIGDRYLVAYSATGGGLGARPGVQSPSETKASFSSVPGTAFGMMR